MNGREPVGGIRIGIADFVYGRNHAFQEFGQAVFGSDPQGHDKGIELADGFVLAIFTDNQLIALRNFF